MKEKKELSRTAKALRNTAAQTLPEIVSQISGLILPRFMLATFGSALTGLVSSINQFILYLRKMEAGLSTASAVNLYKPLAQKDEEKSRQVVSASRHFYRQVGVLFSIGALILAAIYPLIVDVGIEGYTWYKVATLVIILSGSAAFGFFCSSSYQALLIADQRYYVVSLCTAIYGLISIPVILLVIRTENMLIVQLANTLLAGAQALTIAIYAKLKYKKITKSTKDFSKNAMSMRWEVFINEMGTLVETNAPYLIITFILGLANVSVYYVYNMVFVALQSIVRISRDTLRPTFGQAWASGEKETVKSCYAEYEWLIFTMTVVLYTIAGLMLLPFVGLYTSGITDAQYIVPAFGLFFCISGVIRQFQVPASVMVGAAGKFKEVRGSILTTAAVCVVIGVAGALLGNLMDIQCLTVNMPMGILGEFYGGVFLGKEFVKATTGYGLTGVMFGMMCAACIRTSYTTWFINTKVIERGIKPTVIRLFRFAITTVLAILPFITVIEINPSNFFGWLAWAVIVGVWVLVINLISAFLFDKKDMKNLFNRLLGVVKK